MKMNFNRRRFLTLSAGVATAATFGGASQFLTKPAATAHAASQTTLKIAVTQSFPRTYTQFIKGSFAAPQSSTNGASGVLGYDINTSTGALYATVQNGTLDNGTPVSSGLLQVGTLSFPNNRWNIITQIGASQYLFYDANAGVGAIYKSNGQGGLILQRTYTTFRSSWKQIIGGSFGNAQIFFYDPAASTGEFYSLASDGTITRTSTSSLFRSSWYSITPCRFSGSSFDDLLFYDRAAGQSEFYKFDSSGHMTRYASHSGWRTSWKQIVFMGATNPLLQRGLLFYEDGTKFTEIDAVDSNGNLTGQAVAFDNQWFLPWQTILGGEYVPNTGFQTMMSYDPTDGVAVSSDLTTVVS